MTISIRPYAESDFGVLQRANTPAMTEHVGGPETEEKLQNRHRRYMDGWTSGTDRMFTIFIDGREEGIGTAGFWLIDWHNNPVYESGWGVDEEFQGQGLASLAERLVLEYAEREGDRRYVHAFPALDHPASNGVCRKAGFTLVGPTEFEYPKGTVLMSNDWRFDLDTIES